MIKFIIITRRKPDFSRERFFYEWAFIHVSLMLLTAPSMRRFRRYVQHFGNCDISDEFRLLPHPEMNWEIYSEHWLETFEFVHHPDYTEQMQPHSFSDKAMEIVFLEGETMYKREDFRSGGVKLIHRLVRRTELETDDFVKYWREEHAPKLIDMLKWHGLRRYELNLPYEFDVNAFRDSRKGTLFDEAELATASGFEEMWFDSLEDAMAIASRADLRDALKASLTKFVDVQKSYSLFANERVVFDFVTPGEMSPPPAVLQQGSLEAKVFKSGRPFHEPRPMVVKLK